MSTWSIQRVAVIVCSWVLCILERFCPPWTIFTRIVNILSAMYVK